jgi:hypothetical protein
MKEKMQNSNYEKIAFDLSFPHEYKVSEDLKGPYQDDLEVNLTNVGGADRYRYVISLSDRSWILSVQLTKGFFSGVLSTPEPRTLCAVSCEKDS